MRKSIGHLFVMAFLACGWSGSSEPEDENAMGADVRGTLPELIRSLTLERLPEAERLLERMLADPFEEETRRALVFVYEKEGYRTSSNFFAASLGPLQDEQIRYERPDRSVGWGYRYEGQPRGRQDAQIAFKLDELIRQGSYQQAVESAREAIQEHGPSSTLLSAWAHAVLTEAALARSAVRTADLERAWRLYLLCMEELSRPPMGVGGRASGWHMLGLYLRAIGDPVSAHVALEVALQALEEEPEDIKRRVLGWEEELEDLLQELSEEIEARRQGE